MMKKMLVAVAVPPMFLLGSAACKKEAPPPPPPAATAAPTTVPPPAIAISAITLGNAIGPDNKVVTAAEAFGPKDTIYASVETTGMGHAKVRALWTFVKGDKTAKVDETTIELNAVAPTVHEFHVSKPTGWPAGDYRVEIFLGDAAAPTATKAFKVG